MSPEQCRAARAWLGWSQGDLSKRSKVGLSTVKSFENGLRTPISNNLEAMSRALQEAGVEFFDADAGRSSGIAVLQKGRT